MGRFFPAAPQMLIIIINFLYQTRFQQNVPERCGLRFLKKKRIQEKNSISNSETILEVESERKNKKKSWRSDDLTLPPFGGLEVLLRN